MADPNRRPIDLTKRMIVGIFSNGRFDNGGRFYSGWWQHVPSDLCKHITIDGKGTNEYDYSQLKPHIVYFLHGRELGADSAFGRVFDGDHRDFVKAAFNIMM